MSKHMDYMISPYPIRIIDPKVESSKLKLKNIRVGQAGHLPGRTLFRSGVVFEHWAIVYIVSGSGSYMEIGGKEQQVREGKLYFFAQVTVITLVHHRECAWDEYYINFNGTRVSEWLESGLIAGGNVFQAQSIVGLTTLFEEVLERMESGEPVDADRAALLLERMLLECSFIIEEKSWNSQADYMRQIREDLNLCIYGEMDLEQIAAKHHVSMSTLRRLVRRKEWIPAS